MARTCLIDLFMAANPQRIIASHAHKYQEGVSSFAAEIRKYVVPMSIYTIPYHTLSWVCSCRVLAASVVKLITNFGLKLNKLIKSYRINPYWAILRVRV